MSRKRTTSRLDGVVAPAIAAKLADGKPGALLDEGPPAVLLRASEMNWEPLESSFFPPGLKVKALYADKEKNTSLSLVRYPKGYVEPRHYHKGCGHWLYFLRGEIGDGSSILTPGTFIYAPPLNIHGPYTAHMATEVLFFLDGPFDVFAA